MKKCHKCKEIKDLSNFNKAKNNKDGLAYECRDCRQIYRHQNKERDTLKHKEYCLKNREKRLLKGYKTIDRKKGFICTITVEWMKENITSKSCIYCDDNDYFNLGCDRIDNCKGHTMDNCVPCCQECNAARMDNFTHQEMLLYIGPAIRLVKLQRKQAEELINKISGE